MEPAPTPRHNCLTSLLFFLFRFHVGYVAKPRTSFFGPFVEEKKTTKKKNLKAAKLTLTSFAPSREAAETDQRGG